MPVQLLMNGHLIWIFIDWKVNLYRVKANKKIMDQRPKTIIMTQEKNKAYKKKWREEHHDEIREKARQYYRDNKAPYLARSKAQYDADPEAAKLRHSIYVKTHREELKRKFKIYYRANPEMFSQRGKKYREKVKQIQKSTGMDIIISDLKKAQRQDKKNQSAEALAIFRNSYIKTGKDIIDSLRPKAN